MGKSIKEFMKQYHVILFEWHCKNFYPFAECLTKHELEYLNTCFSLAEDFVEASEFGYGNFSYYSYSHRVNKHLVNSSRFAFGSVAHPEECFVAAYPVIRERNIIIEKLFPQYKEHKFYGLGWDFLEDQFKIYWRVPDICRVSSPFKELMTRSSFTAMDEGLISVTLKGNDVFERKVYIYSGKDRAEMLTSNRGSVVQYDLCDAEKSDLWAGKINEAGRKIIDQYRDIGENLDTISIIDKDHYTLYFP